MPKLSPEFLKGIPNFSLEGDMGGMAVNVTEGLIQTTYEAYTSRGMVTCTLYRKEGLRIMADEVGLGVMYAPDGFLTAIRVDVRKFLNNLIDTRLGDGDDENLEGFLELSGCLEDYSTNLVAHVDLETGKYVLLDMESETDWSLVTGGQKDGFEVPGMFVVDIKGEKFAITFQMFDDEFAIGVGLIEDAEDLDDEDYVSPVGDLPGGGRLEEENDFKVSMLAGFVANRCEYQAYFEIVRGNRFDKLARRVFPD